MGRVKMVGIERRMVKEKGVGMEGELGRGKG